ncbi:sialate O-acetylesterase [Schlesneria paludicola]|uniref:sialate O-acetylesterase n=1 Tax=Schlesneria paludicola TaxID=360056 RepID=UPI0002F3FCB0|nr:sialate O-acetylesterase [Schlesneria paludicola]
MFWTIWCFTSLAVDAAELQVSSPTDYQIVQRTTKEQGPLPIIGKLKGSDEAPSALEARLTVNGTPGQWQTVNCQFDGPTFQGQLDVPAGGWYRIALRAKQGASVTAEIEIAHVGVGEVFVVAGQSNSANYGEERQKPTSGRLASFDGERWHLSDDPQPGATGTGGSFIPPFGDAIVAHFNVPVGFVACGIGATSVREWLPQGTILSNPPTLVGRVQQRSDNRWESQGEAFKMLVSRMKHFGFHGFRAVLWHQGESDANQKDPTRTLAGPVYLENLTLLIQESRREIGWKAPWFVAQATYHIPGDEASAEIRDAQQQVAGNGVALAGPDTDAIKGSFRDSGGQGVHFSGTGLREHAARWVDKVTPWLERQLATPPIADPQIGRLSTRRILFLGNSLTLHGPAPQIGWTSNWGMAASAKEKDFVHLLTADIARIADKPPLIMVRNIGDFERTHDTFDVAKAFAAEREFNADLVIVAIGENVPELTTDETRAKFLSAMRRLLNELKGDGHPTIFVRSSFWANPVKDEIMRRAAEDAKLTFVEISKLGSDPTNAASSERKFDHAGVAAHPGDKGMRAIADALLAAILAKAEFAEVRPKD